MVPTVVTEIFGLISINMKRIVLLIIFSTAFTLIDCNHPAKKISVSETYKARIYQTEMDQFGYDIYKDSILMIHQPIVPGVQGNRGFSSKEDAQKVAELMIYKLDNGITPPSITSEELDSLNLQTKE